MARVLGLVGPTGAGKTALALALADVLPIEVVSADSRTVYRWMDIGTAKPTPDERRRVAHHLIDVVDPDQAYSLATYQQQAREAIERITARGCAPVLVGGAGLYVSAVCEGLLLPDVPPDAAYRAALEERARVEGWQALQRDLADVDPPSAARIEPRNVRRLIRALEVFHATGRPFSAWQQPDPARAADCVLVGLRLDRAALDARIDARIDAWLASGFVDEVRDLLSRGYAPDLPSMSGIGYREIARYLNGAMDLPSATRLFKQATHQYARRQMTWFNARLNITWLDAASATPDAVLAILRDSEA
ncbi:MAG TPA: tRNA (adenosine(37)-N6)-dimethylallyltransferase MiaA [Chloroflexota bacterium]